MLITSLENEKIKKLEKLKRKKYRDITNKFIVETLHLVEECIKIGIVEELYVLENTNFNYDLPTTYITNDIMKKISTMDNPSNIIALCKKKDSNEIIGNKILILDEIQDPGNLGTIIRSSVAFNVDTIILTDKTVDLYNPKVLRSTQGMFCHINIINMDILEVIKIMNDRNISIYGTNVVNGTDVKNIKMREKYCLIMGNEGNGLSKKIQDLCDKNLYIPMNKNAESLNVAVACSILLYELGR